VCREYLTSNGFEVHVAYCALEALEILDKTKVDLVITNIRMPGINSLEFTRLIRDKYDLNVIVQTGYSSSYVHEEAIRAGASEMLCKPLKPKDLCKAIERILV